MLFPVVTKIEILKSSDVRICIIERSMQVIQRHTAVFFEYPLNNICVLFFMRVPHQVLQKVVKSEFEVTSFSEKCDTAVNC